MSTGGLVVMLLGKGGREHAIASTLSCSKLVGQVYCVPGNGGTAEGSPKLQNLSHGIGEDDFAGLVKLAVHLNVGLVVAGSEECLVNGVEGHFQKAQIPFFGPTYAAARLEGSKAFAKDFMTQYGIPTARYVNCNTVDAARKALSEFPGPVVIKASGLAAGKGVLMPENAQEAVQAIDTIMVEQAFGNAGHEIVIEDRLEGDEISITFITDGKSFRIFPVGQDAQRILNGNMGANTGGMGAYAPTTLVNTLQLKEIEDCIIEPTIRGSTQEGFPILGFVCIGIILSANGPMLLEYNMRFGDPEAQTLLPMLDDNSDLAQIVLSCLEQKLDSAYMEFRPQFAVSVVVAAAGYPQNPRTGDSIEINGDDQGCLLFHAATTRKDGHLVTDGGRILTCVSVADSLGEAIAGAYNAVSRIRFRGMYFRTDIGRRDLATIESVGKGEVTEESLPSPL